MAIVKQPNDNDSDGSSDYSCNICYEDDISEENIIKLSCCNESKIICIKCVNLLTTPICPYCRKNIDSRCIPYFAQDNNIYVFNSDPSHYSWSNFLREENIINPNLYENSRRLRRQIRRLRYEYNEKKSNYRRQNLNNRRELNNIARNATNNYNNGEDIFFMD
tara:strand:+ start:6768 stop:7256 length:489 start_codon:yes stop_codon:yes gene_type:complete